MSQILNLSLSQKSGTGIKHLAGLILSLSLTTREISQIGIFLSQKKLRAKQQFLFFDKCTIAISLALALTNGGSWQIVICSSGTKRKWCCWWPTPKLRQNAINVSINPDSIFHVLLLPGRFSSCLLLQLLSFSCQFAIKPRHEVLQAGLWKEATENKSTLHKEHQQSASFKVRRSDQKTSLYPLCGQWSH